MGNFNLNNYVEVKDRIAEFYADHAGGSIRTFLVKHEGKEVVFEARVYRSPDEAIAGIYTSGFARELEGDGMVNKTSHVENCETSAIGRALANLDYCGTVGGGKAPRPSREEMQKAERMGGGASNGNGGGNPWDRPMPFGKTKGTPLHDHTDDQLASTIAWCAEKDAEKFADLIAACEATLAQRETAGAA
jgi:hypothetical protein